MAAAAMARLSWRMEDISKHSLPWERGDGGKRKVGNILIHHAKGKITRLTTSPHRGLPGDHLHKYLVYSL